MKRATNFLSAMTGLLIAVCLGGAAVTPLAAQQSCESLKDLKLTDTTITLAKSVAPPVSFAIGLTSNAEVTVSQSFCDVVATLSPAADSSIQIEVWLPSPSSWNGKLLGTGNGGPGGTIVHGALASGLKLGFATANTDMGTAGTGDAGWGYGMHHPEKANDWVYRSTHLMTVFSKEIVRSYYGRSAQHSYFTGCSAGGHQAITEARHYPDDYDGIVAGDDAPDKTHLFMIGLWNRLAVSKEPDSYIPPSKVPMIHNAVMMACDALDGLLDGVIDDPRRCHFDPKVFQCMGADGPDCLTAPQVEALHKLYDGARNPRTHELLFAGQPPGSELNLSGLATLVAAPPSAARARPAALSPLNWVFGATWDSSTFDFDRDVETFDSKWAKPFNMNTSPDLSDFKKHGGKIIFFDGWADALSSPFEMVGWYESIERTMGGPDKTTDFARMFVAPGMSHCFGGDGPNVFGQFATPPPPKLDPDHDVLFALDRWVTRGIAPQKIIATKYVNNKPELGIERTRPLCVYPKVARWVGSGSIDDDANFACVNPSSGLQ
jgi:feruloyl esterase